MATWLDVAVVAFVAQLAALPGEKVQFIIAALSTRFHPAMVVAAAGSAFAGWTVLEIVFGRYLQSVVPGGYLQAMTGLLFLAFAAMLVRSAPSPTDDRDDADSRVARIIGNGGDLDVEIPVLGRRVPPVLGNFLPIFALMAFGEFGDKTQIVTIGLATQYAHGSAIWVGEMAAILPVSAINALFFYRFSGRFDLRKAHVASAALFVFFGVDTLQSLVTGVSVWELVVAAFAALVGLA